MELRPAKRKYFKALSIIAMLWTLASCGGGDDPPPADNTPQWGTAVRVSDNADAQDPALAMDGAGQAIAVWSQSNSSGRNIYARRFNGSIWETNTMMISFNSSGNTTACPASP